MPSTFKNAQTNIFAVDISLYFSWIDLYYVRSNIDSL